MQNDDKNNESFALVCNETDKLLACKNSNEQQILEQEQLVENKKNFYVKLMQYNDDLNKSIAERQAAVLLANNRTSFINEATRSCKDRCKKMCLPYNTCYSLINDVEKDFLFISNKLANVENVIEMKMASYEQKMDNFEKLQQNLIEKRNKKLQSIELEEKRLREENTALESKLKQLESEFFENNDDDCNDPEQLQKELEELQSKLTVLNEDFSRISEEEKTCDAALERIEKMYGGTVFADMEKNSSCTIYCSPVNYLQTCFNYLLIFSRSAQIDVEISQLTDDIKQQHALKTESMASYKTLKEYEKKLDQELSETSKFYEDLQNHHQNEILKFEQEIASIRVDIAEKNKKFDEIKQEVDRNSQLLSDKSEELQTAFQEIKDFSTELQEVEKALESLETLENVIQQFNDISAEVNELEDEQISLENSAKIKQHEIQKLTNQLESMKLKGEEEMVAYENNYLKQTKELEKQLDEIVTNKVQLDINLKIFDQNINELETKKKSLLETIEQQKKENNELNTVYISEKENIKELERSKNQNMKPPASIYAKIVAAQTPDFVFPKLPSSGEPSRKVMKKCPLPPPARHWNSDSSIEGDLQPLNAVLKKKQHNRGLLNSKVILGISQTVRGTESVKL
ncbi:myosin heavy chain, clone 203-like [Euwallacea similis]|uniref:myosin heavy chain, clone 203-like n=1 Tax=Euwallacea similis TaxID=1736056 RepID=UPI003450B8FA